MRQALEMALEALERSVATCFDQRSHDAVMGRPEHFVNQAITAIKEALAQPKQEPVAWEQFYPDIGKPQIAINSETVGYVAPQLKIEGPYHVICQCDKCKAQLKQNDKCREALDRLAEENK